MSRDIRQRDIVPASRLLKTAAVVVGVGAIGRQVATLLAAMGAERITLVDPDTVGIENLAVQGYRPDQIGRLKVEALRADLELINPDRLQIQTYSTTYSGRVCVPLYHEGDELVMFCCVDNIEARKFIWVQARRYPERPLSLWVDGRMAAETLRVLSWCSGQDPKLYDETLFPKAEEHPAPCTGRSTLYSSYVVAGLMVGEFVKWMRDQQVLMASSMLYNLTASELSVEYHR